MAVDGTEFVSAAVAVAVGSSDHIHGGAEHDHGPSSQVLIGSWQTKTCLPVKEGQREADLYVVSYVGECSGCLGRT